MTISPNYPISTISKHDDDDTIISYPPLDDKVVPSQEVVHH